MGPKKLGMAWQGDGWASTLGISKLSLAPQPPLLPPAHHVAPLAPALVLSEQTCLLAFYSCGGAWRLSGTYSPPCLGAGMNPCGHPTPLRGTVLWVDVCPLLGSEMGGQWGGVAPQFLTPTTRRHGLILPAAVSGSFSSASCVHLQESL